MLNRKHRRISRRSAIHALPAILLIILAAVTPIVTHGDATASVLFVLFAVAALV